MTETFIDRLDPDDPDLPGTLNSHLGELNGKLGVEFLAAGRDRVTARMPVLGNRQPANLLHGGANAALAETLGSVHAAILAPGGALPVGIELGCTHHRSAVSGDVIGVCTPLHTGRTLTSFQISISDDTGRAVCTARLTCMYLTPPGS